MRRHPRAVRFSAWIWRTGLWAGLGLGVGLLGALGLAQVGGYRSLTVMSGSMQPAISTGDVVVNEMIPPLAARTGDVVSFRDPSDQDRMITHRLRHARAIGSTVEMETKGDGNNTVERWTMPANGRIGRVIYRVPRLGYFLHWAGSPKGRLLLVAFPTLALGALALIALWRSSPLPPEGSSAGAAAPHGSRPSGPSPESPANGPFGLWRLLEWRSKQVE